MKVTIEGTKEEIKEFMYDCVKDKMMLSVDELPRFSHNIPDPVSVCCHDKSLYEQKVQK